MNKNIGKYNLIDILIILKNKKFIFLILIFIQLLAIASYNYKVKQTYNISIRFTALDFLSYEKIFLIENKGLYISKNNELINDNLNILYYTPYTLFHSYVKMIEQRLPDNKNYDFSWRITGKELSAYFDFFNVEEVNTSIDEVKTLINETNIDFKNKLIDVIQNELNFLDEQKNVYNDLKLDDPKLISKILKDEFKLKKILNNIINTEDFILQNQVAIKNQKKNIFALILSSIIFTIVILIVYSIFFIDKKFK